MEAVNEDLEAGDIAAWDRLRRPIWIFDPTSLRGIYANPPALELWNARTRRELLSRDFSQLSPAVSSRVTRLTELTRRGEAVTESWTFYPKGRPVTVEAIISSVALRSGVKALFFEANATVVDESEVRAVEALRHTSSLISLFDTSGRPLFSNPAAFTAYGDADFAFRFRDARQGQDALSRVKNGEVLAALVNVETRAGRRSHHIDARQVTDPVSGRSAVLLSERDVTAQVEAERALVAARERLDAADAREATRQVERRAREANEAKLRAIFDSSYQLQTMLDISGRVVDANRVALAAITSELSAVKGRLFWETPWLDGTPAVADMVRKEIGAVVAGPPLHHEVELQLPVTGKRTFDLTLRGIRDVEGVVAAVVVEAVDLTERRRAWDA